jgi:ribosomal protein S12 methylthiotransferase accessory factor YcaO
MPGSGPPTAGISEVRDITDLDVLDVPVFVSVRPRGARRVLYLWQRAAPG